MSNAGPGLSPNKQSQTGKVSPTNQHGDTVKANYLRGISDNRPTDGALPAGCINAGNPMNTNSSPERSGGLFATKQPHAARRALGTPGKLTGK